MLPARSWTPMCLGGLLCTLLVAPYRHCPIHYWSNRRMHDIHCLACVRSGCPTVQDVAASYLIGALGGIFYLRMLTRSIDSIGATTLGASAGAAAAQPRFLIPVILVLVYNRCARTQAGCTLKLQVPDCCSHFYWGNCMLSRHPY